MICRLCAALFALWFAIAPVVAQQGNAVGPNPSATGTAATGQIPGTATNDNASAGNVGEYQESLVAIGSAVSITSGVAQNIASLSLTAGDWNIQCNAFFLPAGTTVTTLAEASASTTSATRDQTGSRLGIGGTAPAGAAAVGALTPVSRFSLSTTTTVFCVGFVGFTVSTMTVAGGIMARRVR